MAQPVHATAIVIGTSGLLIVGASGAGKTGLAVGLCADARRAGHFAAFVSDDQVFIDWVNGRPIASAPDSIRGLAELRGSGIGRVETVEAAVLHLAIAPVSVTGLNRIPDRNQYWTGSDGGRLPLVSIDRRATEPFSILTALIDGFPSAERMLHRDGTIQIL